MGNVRVPGQLAIDKVMLELEANHGALAEIGERLSAETLVTGFISSRPSADGNSTEVTVALEVLDSPTGRVLWATSATADESELSRLEQDVVNSLSGLLARRIDRPDLHRVPRTPEAYAAFTKFMLFNSQSKTQKSLPWIEETLRLEPSFAYGYILAGWKYFIMYSNTASDDYRGKAFEAIQQAATLGMDEVPQWQNLRGAYLSRITQNHEDAELVLRKAAEDGVITQYAHLMIASGLPELAMQALHKHLTLYPYESSNRSYLTIAYAMLGQYEAALASTEIGLSFAPHNVLQLQQKSFALIRLGRFDEARNTIETLRAATPEQPWRARIVLAHLAAAEGDEIAVRKYVDRLLAVKWVGHAGFLLLELGDKQGEEYLRDAHHVLAVDLPHRTGLLSNRVRGNPVLRSIIEDYGYNEVWRAELCRRSATISTETGFTCDPLIRIDPPE